MRAIEFEYYVEAEDGTEITYTVEAEFDAEEFEPLTVTEKIEGKPDRVVFNLPRKNHTEEIDLLPKGFFLSSKFDVVSERAIRNEIRALDDDRADAYSRDRDDY